MWASEQIDSVGDGADRVVELVVYGTEKPVWAGLVCTGGGAYSAARLDPYGVGVCGDRLSDQTGYVQGTLGSE